MRQLTEAEKNQPEMKLQGQAQERRKSTAQKGKPTLSRRRIVGKILVGVLYGGGLILIGFLVRPTIDFWTAFLSSWTTGVMPFYNWIYSPQFHWCLWGWK